MFSRNDFLIPRATFKKHLKQLNSPYHHDFIETLAKVRTNTMNEKEFNSWHKDRNKHLAPEEAAIMKELANEAQAHQWSHDDFKLDLEDHVKTTGTFTGITEEDLETLTIPAEFVDMYRTIESEPITEHEFSLWRSKTTDPTKHEEAFFTHLSGKLMRKLTDEHVKSRRDA